MSRPTIRVSIAFQDDPYLAYWTLNASRLGQGTVLYGALAPAPVYTDVTASVDWDRGLTIRRGRNHERGVIDAGTCAFTVDDADRNFDPLNASSPYAPYIKPGRRVLIEAMWDSVTYALYTGFVTQWLPDWDGGVEQRISVTCADAFKALGRQKLTAALTQQRSDLAVAATLNAAGWPAGDRVLGTGQSQVQAVTLTQRAVLDHLRDIETAETGLVFIDGAGSVVFQDRHARLRNTAPLGTFGPGGLPAARIQLAYDDQDIYNVVEVTRVGGTTQSAQDSASKAEYQPRTLVLSGVLVTTDTEAASKAAWLLNTYKDPDVRFRALTLDGDADDALWPHMLGRELSDRVTVRKPIGPSTTIERQTFIESIQHQFSTRSWMTTWQLSPASAQTFWVLGDNVLGRLNQTTILAY